MSMMQPQPGGPPPGASPIPPALLAVLAAHQGAAAPGGPPSPAAPTPDPGENERQPIQILQQMIALANRYISVEPDAEDRATMAKLLATLHQYLAQEQKDAEGALGGGAPTRLLRRLGS